MTKASTVVSTTPAGLFTDATSSGATIEDSLVIDASPFAVTGRPASKRFSYFKAAALATILPFVSLEEALYPRRRHLAEPGSEYIVTIYYEDDFWIESPTVVAIEADRPTLRFPADQPLRIIAGRAPFISAAGLVTEDE